jgi:hypothetical protein
VCLLVLVAMVCNGRTHSAGSCSSSALQACDDVITRTPCSDDASSDSNSNDSNGSSNSSSSSTVHVVHDTAADMHTAVAQVLTT